VVNQKDKADKTLKKIKDLVKIADEWDFKQSNEDVRKQKIGEEIEKAIKKIIRKKQLKALVDGENKPRTEIEKLLGALSKKAGKRVEAAKYASILRALDKGKNKSYLDSLLANLPDEDVPGDWPDELKGLRGLRRGIRGISGVSDLEERLNKV